MFWTLLKEIESLNQRIQEYDERMKKIAKEVYPEVSWTGSSNNSSWSMGDRRDVWWATLS